MLLALTTFVRRRRSRDTSQLALDLDGAPRSADELLARLRTFGMRRIGRCELTRNRRVMVSFRGDALRVHRAYLSAPSDVHQAIVSFVESRSRAERVAARRRIASFPVEEPHHPDRREHTRPDDEPLAASLAHWHARFNADHFERRLASIPVRVSRRMRSRLGHYTSGSRGEPGEIAISWRHLRRHGWDEALETLLHEMVHQWQDETGQPIDHGHAFRAKARELGITPAARRKPVAGGPRAAPPAGGTNDPSAVASSHA